MLKNMKFNFAIYLKLKHKYSEVWSLIILGKKKRNRGTDRRKSNISITNRKNQKSRGHTTNIEVGQQRRKREEGEERGGYKSNLLFFQKTSTNSLFRFMGSLIWDIF